MPISQSRALTRVFGNDAVELRPSRLGKGVIVQGRLDAEGEMHVHGVVLGRIHVGRLVLAVDGYIEGDVVAQEVRIGGRLNGRVFALKVELDSTAAVTGRIFHHTAAVARGAVIDGRMPWRPLNFFESLEQLPEKQP
jgi:cytoskeletal protein CcmA (bactofilin family)